MARLRRDGPYFWVTWLTKLLAGENSCEWASWFRARHESGSWEQVPGDLDRAGWQMAHTAMVNDSREHWEALGCTVFTERQNEFRLRGDMGTRGGQPDLIARKDDAGTIIDVKTGKPGVDHVVQVVLYMYAVPKAIALHRDVVFDGQVAYTDHVVDIPAAAVDDKFVERLSQLIGQLTSGRASPAGAQPRRVPVLPHHGGGTAPTGRRKTVSRKGWPRTSEPAGSEATDWHLACVNSVETHGGSCWTPDVCPGSPRE